MPLYGNQILRDRDNMCVCIYIEVSQHVRRTTSEEEYLWSYTFTFFSSMIDYSLTILSCSVLYIYFLGRDIRNRKCLLSHCFIFFLTWKITLYSTFTCDDSLGTGALASLALLFIRTVGPTTGGCSEFQPKFPEQCL